jgi:predicted phage terminase large subunit-like protein
VLGRVEAHLLSVQPFFQNCQNPHGNQKVTRAQRSVTQIRMFTVTSTIENGFVHVPEIAEWAESYLYELTLFPKGTFADQVDSTSQALG